MATLIRVDRNGTKYWQGMVTCDRCGGLGLYATGMLNGQPRITPVDGGVCYKCGGRGKVEGKWKEYTPEYEAKMKAKREAKWAEEEAKREAERKAREEAEAKKRAEEEARIKAEKAISKYVGQIGDKIEIKATYVATATFDVPSFGGFGTEEMHIHMFKDADGNKLVWKTGCVLDGNVIEKGMEVNLKGTIKDHKEYKEEKQTVLTRCKVVA